MKEHKINLCVFPHLSILNNTLNIFFVYKHVIHRAKYCRRDSKEGKKIKIMNVFLIIIINPVRILMEHDHYNLPRNRQIFFCFLNQMK